MEWRVDDVRGLERVAVGIVETVGEEGATILFDAEMGAGKTTLIAAICKVLGVEDDVSSPTFSIVNEYLTAAGFPAYHFDFYRIEDMEELMDLGVEDYFSTPGWRFVEWPERAGELLPENCSKIEIRVDGATRLIRFEH